MSFEKNRDAVEGSDVAIRAVGLSKFYHRYHRPQDRLKQFFWPGKRVFYEEFLAVRNIDMAVRRGEAVGIVGRNGSGKSTLLKMVCGTLEPTSGSLEVNGHIAPILSIGTGFAPIFTGRENVKMNGAVIGFSSTEIEERMESIEKFADIGDFFDRPVKSYSSGMLARLAFAVAINADPDILVVDEVLAVGDDLFQRKCHARINELKEAGSTILFVSHSAGLVIDLCDRAILLEDGERLLTSDPKTVVSWYHKLLYASREKSAAICAEISEVEAGRGGPLLALRDGEEEAVPEPEAIYDPNLKSESRVDYAQQGAEIRDPRIVDLNGNRANVLLAGHVYTYTYDVVFHEPAYLVRFGMLIKRITGQELGGQASHPRGEGVDSIEQGHFAKVDFRFRALFVPGTYFLNAGALGIAEGEEIYLHRIIDACVFRIDPVEDRWVTGHVDLSDSGFQPTVRVKPLVRATGGSLGRASR